MARQQQDERPRGSKPDYIVRARQSADSDFMVTIGAAWGFKEGDGYVVKMQFIPTDLRDGLSFILVPPKEE